MARRHIPGTVLIFSLLLASGLFLTLGSNYAGNPFRPVMEFRYPDQLVLGSDRDIYLLDNTGKRLSKLNPEGGVEYSLEGGKRNPGTFYQFWIVEPGENDTLFILNVVLSKENDNVEREEILQLGPDGRILRSIAGFSYEGDSRPDTALIVDISVIGNTLYYIFNADGSAAEVYRIDLDSPPAAGGHGEKLCSLEAAAGDLSAVNDFIVAGDGHIWATIRTGNILRMNLEGTVVGNWSGDVQSPYNLADAGDSVYVTDLLARNIVRLRVDSAGKIGTSPMFTGTTFSGTSIEGKPVIFRNLHAGQDGTLVTAEEFSGHLLVFDPEGRVTAELRHGTYGPLTVLLRALYWIQIPFGFFLLGYLLKAFLRGARIRKVGMVVKLLAVCIPFLMLFAAVSSQAVYTLMYDTYYSELSRRLLLAAQMAAQQLDGDALSRITGPEHFGNADYAGIQAKLNSAMNDNADPWNEDLYLVVYRCREDIFYYAVSMTGAYGSAFPYVYAQPVHYAAYRDGEAGVTVYKDFEGEWMIAAVPIRTSGGTIVGVLEAGLDAYIVREINAGYTRKIVTYSGVFILLFSLILFFIIRIILRPVHLTLRSIDEASRGDLTSYTRVRSRDEAGYVAEGFNRLLRSLNGLIGGVVRKIDRLDGSGTILLEQMNRSRDSVEVIDGEVRETRERLERQLEEVTASFSVVEEVVSALDQLNRLISSQIGTISSTSSAIKDVIATSVEVSEYANTTDAHNEELLSISRKGKQELDGMARTAFEIAERSRELMGTSAVIADIAERTNVLSINAAIEAARAGASGKGFGVIAGEVRKLSEQVASQSLSIGNNLNQISESILKVAGLAKISQVGFDQVVAKVEDVGRLMKEVKKAISAQDDRSRAALEKLKEMEEVTFVVAENSAKMRLSNTTVIDTLRAFESVIGETKKDIEAITVKTGEIAKSVEEVKLLGEKNRQSIREVHEDVSRFVIE